MLDASKVQDFKTFSSKTGLKKINDALGQLREVISRLRNNKESPRVIFVQTDSIPVALRIDATVIEYLPDSEISASNFDL